MNEQVSLETCTDGELWKELRSRFSNCVLIFNGDGREEGTVRQNIWWFGAQSSCLGLIEYGRIITRRRIEEMWMEAEAEEEEGSE